MTHAEKTEIINKYLDLKRINRTELADTLGYSYDYLKNALAPNYTNGKPSPRWMDSMVFVIKNENLLEQIQK